METLFLASKQNIFPLNSLLSVVNCYHVILGWKLIMQMLHNIKVSSFVVTWDLHSCQTNATLSEGCVGLHLDQFFNSILESKICKPSFTCFVGSS